MSANQDEARRVYEYLSRLIELANQICSSLIELYDNYRDVIELLSSPDKFQEFVKKLDDATASKLFKTLLECSRHELLRVISKLVRSGSENFRSSKRGRKATRSS